MQVDYEQIHSICVETHLCDKPEHFYLYKCFSWFWFQISIVFTVLERKHASPACALDSVRECNSVDMCPGLVMWSSVMCSFIFTGERNTTYVLDWELIVSHRAKPSEERSLPGVHGAPLCLLTFALLYITWCCQDCLKYFCFRSLAAIDEKFISSSCKYQIPAKIFFFFFFARGGSCPHVRLPRSTSYIESGPSQALRS